MGRCGLVDSYRNLSGCHKLFGWSGAKNSRPRLPGFSRSGQPLLLSGTRSNSHIRRALGVVFRFTYMVPGYASMSYFSFSLTKMPSYHFKI